MRLLIVHYSRTGHTRAVAGEIASRLSADVEEIEDSRSRRGLLGYLRSGREAYRKQVIEIRPPRKDPADYDLVVVGSPVWAGHVASPVRAYLSGGVRRFGHVAAFVTQGGSSGGDRVLAEIANLCGSELVASMAITDREIGKPDGETKIREFVESLRR